MLAKQMWLHVYLNKLDSAKIEPPDNYRLINHIRKIKMNAFDLLMNNSRQPVSDDNDITASGYVIIKKRPPPESQYYLLQFDGLSAPNPGTSTSAAVIFSPDREPLREVAHFITHATNNEAEYGGVILGLETAIKMNIKNLLIEGDSQLVIYQLEGRWKGKDPRMVSLSNIAKGLIASFDNVGIRYVPRKQNKYADKLTNDALELRAGFDRVPSRPSTMHSQLPQETTATH